MSVVNTSVAKVGIQCKKAYVNTSRYGLVLRMSMIYTPAYLVKAKQTTAG